MSLNLSNHSAIPFLGEPLRADATARLRTDGVDDDASDDGTILIGPRATILLRDDAAEDDDDADALDKLADFDAKGVPLANALFSFHAS